MRRRELLGGLVFLAIGDIVPVHARQFMTFEQAAEAIWPGVDLAPLEIELSQDQVDRIQRIGGMRVRSTRLQVSHSREKDWLLLDQVVGKHEYIDVAVGLDRNGAIRRVEILTYRESYGEQVRDERWLRQFVGLNGATKVRLETQIRNISGATLSCRHLADAANRWLATWQVALRDR
jgi:hypothetical protein